MLACSILRRRAQNYQSSFMCFALMDHFGTIPCNLRFNPVFADVRELTNASQWHECGRVNIISVWWHLIQCHRINNRDRYRKWTRIRMHWIVNKRRWFNGMSLLKRNIDGLEIILGGQIVWEKLRGLKTSKKSPSCRMYSVFIRLKSEQKFNSVDFRGTSFARLHEKKNWLKNSNSWFYLIYRVA